MPRIVLLADDSVTAQNMGRRILTDAGYEVITVNNGSAALKKIHESRPDLIVLDVYMPGYGGLEVCQRLKESEATMKIPVLLTVGKMEPFKTDEAKRVRADGHIIKPFDASELLAALTKLEDRIVPQSDGKAKSGKRAKGSVATDPAADFDSTRTEQISYLKREKNRQATRQDSSEVAEKTPASVEETPEDAVTFASGPIYQSSSRKVEDRAQSAPEFPVEKQVDPTESETSQSESVSDAVPAVRSESELESQVEVANVAAETAPVQEVPSSSVESNTQPETPRWVAENVALSAEEASRSLEQEMREANAAAEAVAEPQDEQSVGAAVEARSEETSGPRVPEVESSEGAAFAAAASASNSSLVDAVASPSATEPEPSSSGSESTAPWQEWERIRESVVSQQTAEAIVQSVVASAQAEVVSKDQTPAPETESGPSAQTSEASSSEPVKSGDALSSIVDNVLAELKPRLLAEIAKQLANDKK